MNQAYRLQSYRIGAQSPRAGIWIRGETYDLAEVLDRDDCSSIIGALQEWEVVEPLLTKVAESAASLKQRVRVVTGFTVMSPLLYPGAIYCAAANYRDHVKAISKKFNLPPEPDRGEGVDPFHFLKPSRSTIAGPDEVLSLPKFADSVDWELELVAVIGRVAKGVSVTSALDYVAGYTIGNDLSVRDLRYLKRANVSDSSPFKSDFISLKGFDQSCVLGPWIVPASEIEDPQNLRMKLWVDDVLMQNSTTAEMIFSTGEQLAYLSNRVTLWPGDVIMTGTPAGTGIESGVFLKPGQMIHMEIERIGSITNRISDENC